MGKDKSLFSSHDKESLSSFERYEHHDTVVSLGQLDGMWCKDPLIEADLPMTKQSCSLPTQRVERTKFGGQIKSLQCDFAKNVIVLLWVDDPRHKRDGSRQEPKVTLMPLFKKKEKKRKARAKIKLPQRYIAYPTKPFDEYHCSGMSMGLFSQKLFFYMILLRFA